MGIRRERENSSTAFLRVIPRNWTLQSDKRDRHNGQITARKRARVKNSFLSLYKTLMGIRREKERDPMTNSFISTSNKRTESEFSPSQFWLGCVHWMCVDNTSVYEVYSEKYIKIHYWSKIFYFYAVAQICTSVLNDRKFAHNFMRKIFIKNQ